jgi:hypothetical protein
MKDLLEEISKTVALVAAEMIEDLTMTVEITADSIKIVVSKTVITIVVSNNAIMIVDSIKTVPNTEASTKKEVIEMTNKTVDSEVVAEVVTTTTEVADSTVVVMTVLNAVVTEVAEEATEVVTMAVIENLNLEIIDKMMTNLTC